MSFSCTSTQLEVAGTVPVARSSHGISAAGGAAYLFGGEHVARTPIDSTLYRLDLAAPVAEWEVVPCAGDAPTPRVAHSQAVVAQPDGALHLYIFGGRVGISMDEKALNDLHRVILAPDGKSGTWECLQVQGQAPCPRSFHVMAACGDKLYVFGGCGAAGRLSELHCLDTKTLQWTQLPTLAAAGRGGAGFFASGDGKSLYVIAGSALGTTPTSAGGTWPMEGGGPCAAFAVPVADDAFCVEAECTGAAGLSTGGGGLIEPPKTGWWGGIFIFCRFLGLGHLRGPGVSLGRILGVPSIEPLSGRGGGGCQGPLSTPSIDHG